MAAWTSRAIPWLAAPAPKKTRRWEPTRRPGAAARRGCRPDDRRGPLDVVVEAREALAVEVQQAHGVVLLEVLPLQERVGEGLGHRDDEGLDEGVVGRAPQTRGR